MAGSASNDDICPDNYNYSGADEGKIHLLFLPVPRGRWVRLHAHLLDQLLRRNLRRQLQLLRFKLKGKGRSVKWEVFLYDGMSINVERAQVQFLDSGDMPVVVTTGHGVQTCRKLWRFLS